MRVQLCSCAAVELCCVACLPHSRAKLLQLLQPPPPSGMPWLKTAAVGMGGTWRGGVGSYSQTGSDPCFGPDQTGLGSRDPVAIVRTSVLY